jgi:molybdopterin-guanine dinucleotide biosynthesis protein A
MPGQVRLLGGPSIESREMHELHAPCLPQFNENAVGIVLAGGKSRRLAGIGLGPEGKAAVVVAGESLLGRVCRVIAAAVPRVIVVAAKGQPLPELPDGVEVVRDSTPGAGPLAGLHDGLRHAIHAHRGFAVPRVAFVASCDLPLLSPAVVCHLLDVAREPGVRLVVPAVGGHPQVLASVVAIDLMETIAAEAAVGGGLRAVLEHLRDRQPATVRLVGPDELARIDSGLESFVDIDTPEDLARLEAREIPPSRG